MIKNKKIQNNINIGGRFRIITYKVGTKEITKITKWQKNLVVNGINTGRNLIAQRLASINTYSLNITHGEIGAGTNPPADSDTGLQTPIKKVSTTLNNANNNIVTLQFFFSDSILPNGTYNEFGIYVDNTQLFARALFDTTYTKNSGEDTTIEYELTINST